MYKVEIIPSEKFDHDAIVRRRKEEAARKERIFHPKMRIMGVDTDSLQTQIEQKQFLHNVEEEVDAAYAKAAETQQKIMNILQDEQEKRKEEWDISVDQFRKHNQQPDQRREWYLNDPKVLSKDTPPRLTPEDPRATVSGLQRFAGEDLKQKDRLKAQHEQICIWSAESRLTQATEQQRLKKLEQKHSEQFNATVEALTRLEIAAANARKERNFKVAKENQQLAQERREREKQQQENDTRAKMNDIQGQISGSLLMERSSAQTASHKLLHDAFKGMTNEQKQDIQETRARQLAEKHNIFQNKIQEESKWARQQAANDLAAQLLERQAQRIRRGYNKSVAEFNNQKSQKDKQVREYFDKELYTNQPTQDYFSQFNTSSR